MKKNKQTIISFVISIIGALASIIGIIISIQGTNPDSNRSFFEWIKSLIDFQTAAGWASILGLPIAFIFGAYGVYSAKKSNKELQRIKEELEKQKNEGKNPSDSDITIPEETPASQKGNLIDITSIQRFDTDTIVVNLDYKGSSWTKNLTVEVSENDMCSLINHDEFPQEKRKGSSFVVKLKRHKYNDDTRFSVKWNDCDGDHEKVKIIAFEKGIEIIPQKQ